MQPKLLKLRYVGKIGGKPAKECHGAGNLDWIVMGKPHRIPTFARRNENSSKNPFVGRFVHFGNVGTSFPFGRSKARASGNLSNGVTRPPPLISRPCGVN